jgi:hypothetical protein
MRSHRPLNPVVEIIGRAAMAGNPPRVMGQR